MELIAKGADISKHNGNIDWNKVKKTEVNFVIIRAGFGFNTVDPMFKTYIENAIKCVSRWDAFRQNSHGTFCVNL